MEEINSNHERNIPNSTNINNDDKALIEKVTKSVLFILLIMALTKLVMYSYETDNDTVENITKNESEITNISTNNVPVDVARNITIVEKVIVKQPACPKSYLLVILEEICTELFVKREMCTPGDFYNEKKRKVEKIVENQTHKEAKVPAIINYAIGGLLIASVGAALLELYKAKKQDPSDNGKHPLSRKCSLADLTVLKHHRKELIRRESLMEVPEEREYTRQLGFSPPPLQRRCSFPVGPNTPGGFDKHGMVAAANKSILEPTRRISVIAEGSVVEDRKHSIVVDSRRTSVDSRNTSAVDVRRISVDDSPERRHHIRLVHRH